MDDQQSRYALMQKIASLEQKIQYLETIIEVHHISKFEENLHCLKLNIRSGIRQLSAEFQAMEHDPQNAERVSDLIDYMRQVISELERFTYSDGADQESHL